MKPHYLIRITLPGRCSGWVPYRGMWRGFVETADRTLLRLEWKNTARPKMRTAPSAKEMTFGRARRHQITEYAGHAISP